MASSGLSQNSKVFSDAFNHCKSSVRLRSSSSDSTVYTAPDGRLSTFSRGLKTPLENSTLMLIACFPTFYITLPVAKKPRCRLVGPILERVRDVIAAHGNSRLLVRTDHIPPR